MSKDTGKCRNEATTTTLINYDTPCIYLECTIHPILTIRDMYLASLRQAPERSLLAQIPGRRPPATSYPFSADNPASLVLYIYNPNLNIPSPR